MPKSDVSIDAAFWLHTVRVEPDAPREVDRLAEEMQAVIQPVRNEVRGQPTAEAQQHLDDALRANGMWLPHLMRRNLARHMADPWWPTKHPVGFWREFLESRREAMADQTEIGVSNEEMEELAARLEDIPELRSIRRRGWPGDSAVYVVTIDPWSARVAGQIEALAAPAKVVVEHES